MPTQHPATVTRRAFPHPEALIPTTIKVPAQLKAEAKALAYSRGTTFSAMIMEFLYEEIDRSRDEVDEALELAAIAAEE